MDQLELASEHEVLCDAVTVCAGDDQRIGTDRVEVVSEIAFFEAEPLDAPFAHVYDGIGENVLNADGALVPGARWRAGALYVQRLTLDIPADSEGPYVVELGQWDPLRNVNVVFMPPDEEPTPFYLIEG